MNQQLEDLMYHAGLTASGCWDKMDDYDRKAIENFALLIVRECIDIVGAGGEFASRPKLVEKLQEHFGVEE